VKSSNVVISSGLTPHSLTSAMLTTGPKNHLAAIAVQLVVK